MFSLRELGKKVGVAGVLSLGALVMGWVGICLLLVEDVRMAFVCGMGGFLLDALDGMVARRMGTVSRFGRQLDGMVDVVCYVLFAALAVAFVLMPSVWGVLVGAVVVVTGILRLARFGDEGFVRRGKVVYYRGVVVCVMLLLTGVLAIVGKFVAIPEWAMGVMICGVAVMQLSNVLMRKSGAMWWWVPVGIGVVVGGLIWL
jgi:CDP-diacylglycerol--serine O-phosphatidyltransferase